MNNWLNKNKLLNKNTLFSLILVVLISSTVLVFKSDTAKTEVKIYPSELTDVNSILCEVALGSLLFPKTNLKYRPFETISAKLIKEDSTLALEVDGNTLKLITNISVEIGQIDPKEYLIANNTETTLSAVFYSETAEEINTLIINKKTGFGTWTRSVNIPQIREMPTAQTYYLSCI